MAIYRFLHYQTACLSFLLGCFLSPCFAQEQSPFVSFEANLLEDYVELTWETRPDNTCLHFEIQRSIDGKLYHKVGKEKAFQDKDGANYLFIDSSIEFNKNVYYRIISFNSLKDTTHSNIQILKIKKVVENVDWVSNPNDGSNSLKFNGLSSGSGEIKVYDSEGEELVEKEITVRKGINNSKIELNGLPNGLYFVQFKATGGEWGKWVLKTAP